MSATTAFLTRLRFAAFLAQKPDNRQRPERVNPPRSKHSLSNEADHHDEAITSRAAFAA
jgi:hypothetical protein